MIRTKLAAGAVAATMVVAGLMGASSASAATTDLGAQSVIVKSAAAPTCVTVTKTGRSWGFPYVKIRNDCRTTQRVKVLWAWAPDSSCRTLSPGQSYTHKTGAAGRFDGLARC